MNYSRLNISDAEQAINVEVHGCPGDVLAAVLIAEHETVKETGFVEVRFSEG